MPEQTTTKKAPKSYDAKTLPAEGRRLAPQVAIPGAVAYVVSPYGKDPVTGKAARNPWEAQNPNAVRTLVTAEPVDGWILDHVVSLQHARGNHDMGDWRIVAIKQVVEVQVPVTKDGEPVTKDGEPVTEPVQQVKIDGKPILDKGKNPCVWTTQVIAPEAQAEAPAEPAPADATLDTAPDAAPAPEAPAEPGTDENGETAPEPQAPPAPKPQPRSRGRR